MFEQIQRRTLIAVLFLSCILGCSGRSLKEYRPDSTLARQALSRGLDAWKAGKPMGTIDDSKPAVDVYDARWRDKVKLDSYEIVEEILQQEQVQFKVKLQLQGLPPQENNYLVIGIDPLLIFRDVDYGKATGM